MRGERSDVVEEEGARIRKRDGGKGWWLWKATNNRTGLPAAFDGTSSDQRIPADIGM